MDCRLHNDCDWNREDKDDLHQQDHAVWKMNNKAEASKWFLKHFLKITLLCC